MGVSLTLSTESRLEMHAQEQYPWSADKFYVCVCQNEFSCENCVVIVEGIIFLEKCMKTIHMQMDNPEVFQVLLIFSTISLGESAFYPLLFSHKQPSTYFNPAY